MPRDKLHDLDFIVDQLDWDKNVGPNFKDKCWRTANNPEPAPVAKTRQQGFADRRRHGLSLLPRAD